MPTFTRNGFTTYYEEVGDGEPVVLICGLGADLQAWHFLAPELSKHWRVVTYDNRGAGRSDAPDEPYSITQMADDLDALLGHLAITKVAIIGWSMGGVIAQALAHSSPERVRQRVLLSTFIAPDDFLKAAISHWVDTHRAMPFELVARHLARMVFSPDFVNNSAAYESFIHVMLNNPYRQPDHGFFRQADALLSYRTDRNRVAPCVPTTVIVGEHDQLTPPYLSEQLTASIHGAHMQILPGAHLGFLEHPDRWAAAITLALENVHAP